MKNNIMHYSVGALLYCPANKKDIADSILSEKFGSGFSLALCLEDTIHDSFVEEAEHILQQSIRQIHSGCQSQSFYLPKIFIRVRNPGQITRLTKAFGGSIEILTGFIVPKFTTANADSYIQAVITANETASKELYMMPIYENAALIDLRTRTDILYRLKDSLALIEDRVLNIRVGGNDLCHIFGFRRHADESIHRIRPVANLFADIITVYGADYVVSGPVWEYYSGPGWESGLREEIADDKLCGFIGKTVIHPKQIPVVKEACKVSRDDLNDARAILNWNLRSDSFVSGNPSGERMNEYKTHSNWARKILFMAKTYGVRET